MSKESRLAKVISQLEFQRAHSELEEMEGSTKDQVNLRVNSFHRIMLDTLAKRYDMRRGTFGAAILHAAIEDAWEQADLGNPTEDKDVQLAWTDLLKEEGDA